MFFGYPKDVRKAVYTTNAIESLNSVIRTAVNKRKVFPSDQAAFKVVTQQPSKHPKSGRCLSVTVRLL